VIRVALVDDHPAVRAGLHAILRSEPGFSPISVPVFDELTPRDVLAAGPTVALVDGQLAVGTGLGLCLEISRLDDAPPTLLYSAYVDEELAIAARLAGAAGAVNKSEPLDELLDALRVVAAGGSRFPSVAPWALRRCADRLEPDDLPFLSMLAHGTNREETADTLGVTGEELEARLVRVVSALEHRLLPGSRAADAVA
jgi:DNA-binding NarL/FixJ family response regulator